MSIHCEMLDYPKSSVTDLIRAMDNVEFVKRYNYKLREVITYEDIMVRKAARLRAYVIRLAMIELGGGK